MDVLVVIVAAVALLLTGAVAGLFFAYGNSVLPGLGAAGPRAAIGGMTGMNRKIINPRFLASFLGPPVVAALAGVLALVADATTAGLLFLCAAVVYVMGTIVPTAVVNVPMNNALDAGGVPDDEAEAARVWSAFATRWTRWNTVRTAASLASLLLIGLGLLGWGQGG